MSSALAVKMKIGALLLRERLLTKEQLAQSLEAQKNQYPDLPLGQICVNLGFLSSDTLSQFLGTHHRRIPLGELLIHLGLVSADQLQSALEQQHREQPHKKLGSVLVDKGLVESATLIRVLYEQSQRNVASDGQEHGKFTALIVAGRLSRSDLDEALKQARLQQLPVEEILIKRHHLSKREIGAALGAYYRCAFVEYEEGRVPPKEHVQRISPTYLKANYWIPLAVTENSITVLMDDPRAATKIEDIRRLFPGKVIERCVGFQDDILRYITRVFEKPGTKVSIDSLATILGQLDNTAWAEPAEPKEEQLISENDSAVVRLVNQIITEAWKQGASDIHVEPGGSERETRIRFRVDGRCLDYIQIPAAYRRALVSRIKIMAGLDIAEKRKPQDGKIKLQLRDRILELRVVTIPTAGTSNEDVVMRLLMVERPKSLDELFMTERNHREFCAMLTKPYGLILCVGPTGAGKTTTLHSALNLINKAERKIWTAEDPVEITQPGLRQVQVQPKIGFNFAAAMRAFLRADPDVIMVGEIRDEETAEVAIEASLTGHLVLSTLHTNSAVETITRLLEMGIDPFNFADSLLGVMAQRLARMICSDCRESYEASQEEFALLAHAFGAAEFAEVTVQYGDSFRLYRGRGCASCRGSGYRGRIALHELLVVTDTVKELIHGRVNATQLLELALAEGMTTLVQDGVLKILEGWTDYNQVKAVAMR
jgi:type II secretory ATPase GspE/PulE/Tfp pilus assembly ATPase PilB-like protein